MCTHITVDWCRAGTPSSGSDTVPQTSCSMGYTKQVRKFSSLPWNLSTNKIHEENEKEEKKVGKQ
jgi:hypothetical protein